MHRGKLGRWLLWFALRASSKWRPGRYPQINQFSFNIEICVHRFPNPSFRQSQPADEGASNTTGRQANFVNQTSLKLSGAWLPYCCPKVCARCVPDVEVKMKLKIVFFGTQAPYRRGLAPHARQVGRRVAWLELRRVFVVWPMLWGIQVDVVHMGKPRSLAAVVCPQGME